MFLRKLEKSIDVSESLDPDYRIEDVNQALKETEKEACKHHPSSYNRTIRQYSVNILAPFPF